MTDAHTVVTDPQYEESITVTANGDRVRLDINNCDRSPIIEMTKEQARDLIDALWLLI